MPRAISATITTTVEVSTERLGDLLSCAFEGGMMSGWGCIEDFVEPPATDVRYDSECVYRHIDYPLNEGGAVIIRERGDGDTDDVHRLDLVKIQKTLPTFLATRHGADFMAENDDAITGDVFVQMCLFGEVLYG